MHVFLGPCLLTVSVVAFPDPSLSINRSLKQLGYPFYLPLMHKSLNLGDPGILLASLSQLYLFDFSIFSYFSLPLLSHPPYSPGWAEGENRAGLQGTARNKMPPSPIGGAHATSSNLARGWRNRHQCAGQALGPHREALPGQSTA